MFLDLRIFKNSRLRRGADQSRQIPQAGPVQSCGNIKVCFVQAIEHLTAKYRLDFPIIGYCDPTSGVFSLTTTPLPTETRRVADRRV